MDVRYKTVSFIVYKISKTLKRCKKKIRYQIYSHILDNSNTIKCISYSILDIGCIRMSYISNIFIRAYKRTYAKNKISHILRSVSEIVHM